MSKTLLIVIGLLAALLTAAGCSSAQTEPTARSADSRTLVPLIEPTDTGSVFGEQSAALGIGAKKVEPTETSTSKENKTEIIDFTGTVTEINTWNNPQKSRLDWFIRIKIKELSTNTQTIQHGKEIIYFIHSPVQFFHEPREKAVGKDYKFRAICSRNEKGEVTIPGLKVMDELLKQRPLLYDKDASVRQNALRVLVAEYDTESIPEIRKLLNDNSDAVRGDAAGALMILGGKESIHEIKNLINDRSEQIRKDAAYILKQLGLSEKEIEDAKKK